MKRSLLLFLLVLSVVLLAMIMLPPTARGLSVAQAAPPSDSDSPRFTSDGKLEFPENYREWVYLTSGLNMSYSPRVAGMEGHDMFDNVFVNPSAYKAFLETGTWPDQTMLVLEVRGAGSNASINKAGHFQNGDVMGREVHLKTSACRADGRSMALTRTKPLDAVPARDELL